MMKLSAALIMAAALLCGCDRDTESQSDVAAQDRSGGVYHVVLGWLKEPGNKQHRQQIIERSQVLRSIPGVLEFHAGTVVESDRPVVEDSYDIALLMRFESKEAMDTYLVHPDHVNTVRTQLAPLLERYQVMDFSTRQGAEIQAR